ncbi:hypothetical protein ABIC83_003019 [Roseateles asaccharophilus]|uniref:hypothetical protein n=1 Tax=Roseateles asaccharophilus TaxID=582607 RepID=UPI003836EEFE
MGFALDHLFADSDARLDGVLESVRREKRAAEGKSAREQAGQVLHQIERHRWLDLDAFPALDVAHAVVPFNFEGSPYDELMRRLRLARLQLNPIAEALEAAQHVDRDRRTVRYWLQRYARMTPRTVADSALLMWLMVRTAWRKLLARLSTRITTRRSSGFFGVHKVDGRNTP